MPKSYSQDLPAPAPSLFQALLSAHLFPDPSRRRVDNPVASPLQGES
jgi:hypothetical protein